MNTLQQNIIIKSLEEFSNLANLTLAKKIYAEDPFLFDSLEQVRSAIRYYRGASGKKHLLNVTEKFLPAEKIKAKYNIPANIDTEYKPFILSGNRGIILGDVHIPFHSVTALNTMFDYTVDKNVDFILINGDFMDCFDVSNFNHEPGLVSMKEERDMAKELLKEFKTVYPKAKIYYKFGNHECYEKNTEVLTNVGWKKISEISSYDIVANYDMNDGSMFFASPTRVITKHADMLYAFESDHHKQIVTAQHECIYKNKKIRAIDLANQLEVCQSDFPLYATQPDAPPYPISDDWIRLIAHVVADGSIVDCRKWAKNPSKSTKFRVQFKLSREDKICALEKTLQLCGIPYTKSLCKKSFFNKLQPYYIRIYGDFAREIRDILGGKKAFPQFFRELNNHQISELLNILSITDGHKKDARIEYASTAVDDINLLHEIFTRAGYISHYKKVRIGYVGSFNKKPLYSLTTHLNRVYKSKINIDKIAYHDMVYCVEVPSGALITRHSGKIGISGNCRLEHYLMRKAPELFGMSEFRLEVLLDLYNSQIEYIPENVYVEISGGLSVFHGHEYKNGITSPANPARTAYLRAKDCAVVSHYHQSSEHTEPSINGKIVTCWSTGCMCGLHPNYMPLNRWNQGFALYTREDEQFWHVKNKRIIGTKVV